MCYFVYACGALYDTIENWSLMFILKQILSILEESIVLEESDVS